jgi:hypothetical protein
MAKKLTANAVNSAAKKTYKMTKCHLTDINGEVWDVIVDTKMNPVKANEMAKDILIMCVKMHDEGVLEEFNIDEQYPVLLYPMIMRHFTDLEITDKESATETLNSYVNLLENLISLGLLEQLMGCFEEDGMKNAMETFKEASVKMSDHVIVEAMKIAKQAEEQPEEAE